MMARFMHGHVGELFDGVVSGVSEWGVYVALSNGAEGFLHVRGLDDWFDFDEHRLTLRGERTGFVFSLGQQLCVRVESVELEAAASYLRSLLYIIEDDRIDKDSVAEEVKKVIAKVQPDSQASETEEQQAIEIVKSIVYSACTKALETL